MPSLALLAKWALRQRKMQTGIRERWLDEVKDCGVARLLMVCYFESTWRRRASAWTAEISSVGSIGLAK